MSITTYDNPKRLTALRRFAATSTIITILGHAILGFEQAFLTPIVAVLTAYTMQLSFEWARARSTGVRPIYAGGFLNLFHFLLPAHIVGLTCSMLMFGGDRLTPVIFAATLAIASKQLLRVRINGASRHFLNPSNVGILGAMVCFPAIGIILPYQFHSGLNDVFDVVLPLTLFGLGGMLNATVTKRIPLIAAWLGSFILQAALRYLIFDQSFLAILGVASGTTAILFTFYMITDPGTTPDRPAPQMLFGASVGLLYGVLTSMHFVYALFWALVIVSGSRGLFMYWLGRRQLRAPNVRDDKSTLPRDIAA